MDMPGERIAIWAFGRSASGAVVRRADGGSARCFLDLDAAADPLVDGSLRLQASVEAYDGRIPPQAVELLARDRSPEVRAAVCAVADDRVLLSLLLDESEQVRTAAVSAEQAIEGRVIGALSSSTAELSNAAEGECNHRVLAAIILNPAVPRQLAMRLARGRIGQPAAPVVRRALERPGTILLGHLNTFPEHLKQARSRGLAPCA